MRWIKKLWYWISHVHRWDIIYKPDSNKSVLLRKCRCGKTEIDEKTIKRIL